MHVCHPAVDVGPPSSLLKLCPVWCGLPDLLCPTQQANNVSCVGVISHSQGGGLAASLCSSDLCGLLPEQFAAALSMPVLQYLQAKASAGWGAQQHSRLQQQQAQEQQQQQQSPSHQGLQQQQQRPEQQGSAGSAHTWGIKVRHGHTATGRSVDLLQQATTIRRIIHVFAISRSADSWLGVLCAWFVLYM